jgi:NAD(P)-dependent dehydrogenase (short-subunit alcohol dehydrogenase family)
MRPIAEATILVTGATDGLGKAVALELARDGARVLVHGRDDERGAQTLRELESETGNDKLEWYCADLASLANVRELAERVSADHDRLDVLVNNAGIGTLVPGGGARMESEDGYELRFAVNYLAPFLLSHLLEPLLVGSAPARIVNVSSAGQADLRFDDLMLENDYDSWQAYCQSKLALVMLTLDLAEDLADRGVTATCLHPGTFMPTKMVLEAGRAPMDTLETGIEATLRLIRDRELESVTGKYFERQVESRALDQAYDEGARRRLRELSDQLVGLSTTAESA